ncbi:hypothetical protein HW509_14100 [Asaia spathodeae]|uniref:hypothetical protein n=1 Tax=Asaia spathodeae TaxID=657016 RepID=UPI002FC2BC50
MKRDETKAALADLNQSSHAIGCLSLLLRFAGSYASGGTDWPSKEVSALGAAVVWAALEIEHHSDVIDAAKETIEASRPEAMR